MRLLPRSLFRRNLLLIVGLILLGQIANAVLFRELVMKPRLQLAADAAVSELLGLREALQAVPAGLRGEVLERFNRHTRAVDGPDDPTRLLRRARRLLERGFVEQVGRRVAPYDIGVAWRDQGRDALVAQLRLEGSDYRIDVPSPMLARQFSRTWLLSSVATGLLAVLGAWLIQRRINRPLNELVDAAAAFGQGNTPPALPEDGPPEIATVAHAFNQMVASLSRNEQERSLMLAGLSHDLRTPLAKMRLASEMLQGRGDAELLASLDRNIEAMDRLLTQFLDFTRLGAAAGASHGPLTETDLNEVAREAVLLAGEGISFVPGTLSSLRLQPDAVRRLVLNLVVNAQRHGAPPIEVATGTRGAETWLEVRDRGPGIAPEVAETLKEPFARGDRARGGADGAGLGLAIVERIARMHGARLDLLPRSGGGLVARVTWGGRA
ncbi:ATP-binding protein [Schlegelella sp. S2-27]|uniref:histidine kinase n=1 Tax=Caldimonas mangrovi TaxID=2944811 RepID=A0ABT0YR65_9BURK|nr:ATP-binding protein [Caldimonas mangrovi]MCM5681219.1 ATP-binding protein [Caldimonas mangrovi]